MPSNWSWQRLTDVFYSISPSGNKILSSKILDSGKFPVVDQGKRYIAGYINEEDLVINIPGPVVVFGDHTTELKLIDFDFVAGADGVKILRPILLNERYFYWYLKTIKIEDKGYSRHYKILAGNLFPLPPAEEQCRIVAKVNELMALCDKLETQQQQRRSQQNKLRLTTLQAVATSSSSHELQTAWTRLADNFGQLFHSPNDLLDLRQCIKRLALGGLLSNQNDGEAISPDLKNAAITSSHPVTEAHMDWEIPNQWIWARTGWLGEARLGKMLDASKNKGELLPYLRNINVRWRKFQLTDVLTMRVETHELPKISVRQGDLVICEGGEPGRAAIWREPRDFVIQKALHRFRCGKDVLPEYMLLCLEHDYFSGRLSRYYTGATIKHLTGRSLSEYAIPLPPIAEQDRIVKRVDELTLQCDQLERQLGSALQIADRLAISTITCFTGITSTLSDYTIHIFQDRHSGRDCRNPGPMDGLTLAIHGTGCPLPGGHDELSDNLTK